MHKEPQVEHSAPKDAGPPMETWTILFLDGAKNIERVKVACKEAGHTVLGARTIEEAWALLDGKHHVEVIVCAAHLEEGSMFEFLRGVRKSKVHGNAKFLILSLTPGAMGKRLHRSTASAGVALGADAYATMPVFDPDELVALIKKLQSPIPMPQKSTPAEREHRAK